MDLSKESRVFHNDPVELKKYVGLEVKVVTKGNDTFQGIVYTIDPVTESLILYTPGEEGNGSIQLILGHVVQTIEKLTKEPNDVNLFETNLIFNKSDIVDDASMVKLKSWLQKNLIPVEEDGATLKCCSVVTILPPYTPESCLSTNEIVLDNIQRLIRAMPQG